MGLGETAAIRVAYNSQVRDGQFDNVFAGTNDNERDKQAVRAQLAWEPREDVRTLLNFHWGEHDGTSRSFKSIGFLDPVNPAVFDAGFAPISSLLEGRAGSCPDPNIGSLNSACVSGVEFTQPGPPPLPSGPLNNPDYDEVLEDTTNMVDRVDAAGGSFRLEWDLDIMTIMSLTAFETSEYHHMEADGVPANNFVFGQNGDQQQWSQEVRFSSPEDQQLRWIAGAYYFEEDTQSETIVSLPFAMMGLGGGMSSQLSQTDTVYAGFIEFEYDFSEKLTGIIGGRYSSDKKEGWARIVATQHNGNIPQLLQGADLSEPLRYQTVHDQGGNLFIPYIEFEESWKDWGAKCALEYQYTDDVLVYASASKGIKSGGFTTGPNIIFADSLDDGLFNDPVDPETVWAFEAGLKGQWFNNTLRTNLAGFYNDYQAMQVQSFFLFPQIDGGTAVEGRLLNVGDTTTAGIELEMLWLPPQVEGLSLTFNGGWLHTTVDTDTTGLGIVGNELPNSPEITFQVIAEKRWQTNFLGEDELSLIVDGHYSASREYHIQNNEFLDDGAFFVLNVSGHYQFGPDMRYRISAWGKNVNDADYFNNMIELGFGDITAYQNDATSYGLTFTASYE
jgi:iron complex outermembrane receptor protein